MKRGAERGGKSRGKREEKWTPEMPVSDLPEEIAKIYQEHAAILLEDLRVNKLEVKLTQLPDGRRKKSP